MLADIGGGRVGAAVTGAADDERADEAIASFVEYVEDVGFEAAGAGEVGDVLGLLPVDAAEGEGLPSTARCIGSLGELVADDGSFVGEVTRATSEAFELVGDAPERGEDGGAFAPFDSARAVVVFVEDGRREGLADIVETFASDEFVSCIEAAFTTGLPADEGVTMNFELSAEEVDVGDGGALVEIRNDAEVAGEQYTFSTTVALGRLDRALAVVFVESNGERVSELRASDALATVVSALDG
jgi:hypothetical protein